MWDQSKAPMRVSYHATIGDGLFQFNEPHGSLSPLEVKLIVLELRLAALEARMPAARWHRLLLHLRAAWTRRREGLRPLWFWIWSRWR